MKEINEKLKEILIEEKRWTPKALEHFGVTAENLKLIIPLWGNGINRIYDFLYNEKEKRIKNPKGSKVKLFGNIHEDEIFLLEGEWDLFCAYENGITNVVTATNGAGSFNQELAKILSRKVVNIVFDLDQAGENGSVKVAEMLKAVGCLVRIVKLPQDLGAAGDVRDFFTKFNYNKAEFLDLVNETSFYKTEIEQNAENNLSNLICLADVQKKEIEFLWRPYVALGFVTLLTGDPGVGKSSLALKIASMITKGQTLWNGSESVKGKVVFFSIENPEAEVLKPQLEKANADHTQIFSYSSLISLDEVGFQTIRYILNIYKPKLVIIDPVVAYLGSDTDMNKATDIRDKMTRLSALAKEYCTAILVVRHMAKANQSKLIYAGHGSIDFVAAARSELMMVADPTNEKIKYVGHVKSNLTKIGPTLVFENTHDGLVFLKTEQKSLSSIVSSWSISDEKNINDSEISRAVEAIKETLRDAPLLKSNFISELKEAGFSRTTIDRSLKLIGKSFRISYVGQKAGSGSWIVATFDQIQALEGLKFDGLESLERYLSNFQIQDRQNSTSLASTPDFN